MQFYYFDSPHKQITENFRARVIKVTDGDTVRVTMSERNFDFPIRMADIAAPELNERGGRESQKWLSTQILGKDVEIIINERNRVGKWGRLLGAVMSGGMDMGELSKVMGHAVSWDERASQNLFPKLESLL